MNKAVKQLNIEYAVALIHFLLTFWFERILFHFDGDRDLFVSAARTETISDTAEYVLVYGLSKLCAALIIWLLWKLLFAMIYRRISRETIIVFAGIYVLGGIIGLILFPDTIGIEIDNYTNYGYAVRFLPTYWHSVFTGALYGGCLMVIPHPISIFLFQWMAFNAVMAWIWSHTRFRVFVLLLYFLPESFQIIFNPYRNNYYTILCMFYVSYLLVASRQRERHARMVEVGGISALTAFLMVWRSEGVMIGAGGLIFLLLFIWKRKFKWIAAGLLICGCVFVCLSSVQRIGMKKYYGQDYMFINTMGPLHSILNNPQADLSYEGAAEDLAAIGDMVPVEVIKQYALTGYRDYNYTSGRADFNQTLAKEDTARQYMSAYYRIIFHNIGDYLDVQTNYFFTSLQVNCAHTTYSYSQESYIELDHFVYDSWFQGYEDLRRAGWTAQWERNEVRKFLNIVLSRLMTIWRELWTATSLNVLIHVGTIVASILILCMEFIHAVMQKDRSHWGWLILFATVFGEMCAIALFMPEGRAPYLYPVLYADYVLLFFYMQRNLSHTEKRQGQALS